MVIVIECFLSGIKFIVIMVSDNVVHNITLNTVKLEWSAKYENISNHEDSISVKYKCTI